MTYFDRDHAESAEVSYTFLHPSFRRVVRFKVEYHYYAPYRGSHDSPPQREHIEIDHCELFCVEEFTLGPNPTRIGVYRGAGLAEFADYQKWFDIRLDLEPEFADEVYEECWGHVRQWRAA